MLSWASIPQQQFGVKVPVSISQHPWSESLLACDIVPRSTDIPGRILGPDHPTVATYRNNLGLVMQDLGDPAGAKTQFKRALAITEASLGADHPTASNIRENLDSIRR